MKPHLRHVVPAAICQLVMGSRAWGPSISEQHPGWPGADRCSSHQACGMCVEQEAPWEGKARSEWPALWTALRFQVYK